MLKKHHQMEEVAFDSIEFGGLKLLNLLQKSYKSMNEKQYDQQVGRNAVTSGMTLLRQQATSYLGIPGGVLTEIHSTPASRLALGA